MAAVTTVIFVHGAWADGSAWSKVLPAVASAGLAVTAVQLSLTSLGDDAAIVHRAIALAEGPVLLVGHSYGGAVITEAGNDPRVVGLAYVAGFAPDAGESAGSLGAGGPPTPLPGEVRPDPDGFLKLTRRGVDECFAQDLPDGERATVFATQGPVAAAALGAQVTVPAWKGRPSWYLVTSDDRAIHPDLQRRMASRMGATVTTVQSSHVPMLSEPHAVIDLVLAAAK